MTHPNPNRSTLATFGAKVIDGGLNDLSDCPSVWLGIDQSYTGFAVTALAEDDKYFTWSYASKKKGTPRLVDIKGFLVNVLDMNYTIEEVAMEGYAYGSQMANMLGELGGMVKMALYYTAIDPLIVAPTQLKKFATSHGTKVSKAEILLAVYKHWGVEFRDDNMADSYVLARIASNTPEFAYQREVMEKVLASREASA